MTPSLSLLKQSGRASGGCALADSESIPIDARVRFTIRLAVGTEAFPQELFKQLDEAAARQGKTANALATEIVRDSLNRKDGAP